MPRRVVTANDEAGLSYVAIDEIVDEFHHWKTTGAEPLGPAPAGSASRLLPTTARSIEPGPGGTHVGLATLIPWTRMKPMMEKGDIPGLDPDGFHRTETIDYILVLDGPLELVLDKGEVVLQAGDLVIQRNTNHSWRNHTEHPVRIWATMVAVGTGAT